MKCKYHIAWIGDCGKDPCSEHDTAVCISCGTKATHSCDSTSSVVCGFDLCDGCEHDDANGGHKRKLEETTNE